MWHLFNQEYLNQYANTNFFRNYMYYFLSDIMTDNIDEPSYLNKSILSNIPNNIVLGMYIIKIPNHLCDYYFNTFKGYTLINIFVGYFLGLDKELIEWCAKEYTPQEIESIYMYILQCSKTPSKNAICRYIEKEKAVCVERNSFLCNKKYDCFFSQEYLDEFTNSNFFKDNLMHLLGISKSNFLTNNIRGIYITLSDDTIENYFTTYTGYELVPKLIDNYQKTNNNNCTSNVQLEELIRHEF